MVTSLNFTIHDETGESEYGTAMIVPSRTTWYSDPVTVMVKQAVADLRLLYRSAAVEQGRLLHHVDCILTNDPGKLDILLEHDCAECQAGAARGRAFLAENPQREIVIARLHWVKM